jgi:hypothetical protein
MPSIPEHKPESPESTGTGTAAIDEKTTQLADTGVLPLISASFWTLSLGKWLANTRLLTTLAFQKTKPCSDRSLHVNGVLTDRLFPKMGECREVLGRTAPPSKL